MSKPGIAAVLSFLVPGLGQLYNGTFTSAAIWFLVTLAFHIGTFGLFGWFWHFACAYYAYRAAEQQQSGVLPR